MIHCNFGCPALKNESIKVGQIINLFFYIDFMVKNCKIVLPETREEYIDDNLTDVELKFLSGTYHASTGMYFITNCWLNF